MSDLTLWEQIPATELLVAIREANPRAVTIQLGRWTLADSAHDPGYWSILEAVDGLATDTGFYLHLDHAHILEATWPDPATADQCMGHCPVCGREILTPDGRPAWPNADQS